MPYQAQNRKCKINSKLKIMIWELESSWCAVTISVAVIMVWIFHVKSRLFSLITAFISFWDKV